jgi:hypothetical protein
MDTQETFCGLPAHTNPQKVALAPNRVPPAYNEVDRERSARRACAIGSMGQRSPRGEPVSEGSEHPRADM